MDIEKCFEELGSKTNGAELGDLFGKTCGKKDKKAFICLFNQSIVFEIGHTACTEWQLILKDSINFAPSGKGRPMKDWLEVPTLYKKYYDELLRISLDYTLNP